MDSSDFHHYLVTEALRISFSRAKIPWAIRLDCLPDLEAVELGR
jgi:hypothetical protein